VTLLLDSLVARIAETQLVFLLFSIWVGSEDEISSSAWNYERSHLGCAALAFFSIGNESQRGAALPIFSPSLKFWRRCMLRPVRRQSSRWLKL